MILDVETKETPQRMKATDLFETAECGRCGGSGHYSFNMMSGTVCFGCGGSGIKFTKKGAAAKTAWIEAYQKTAKVSDLVPGDKVMMSGRGGRRTCLTIESSHPYALQAPRWELNFVPGKGLDGYVSATGDDLVDLPVSADEKRAAYDTIRHMPGALATKEVY